MGDFNRLNEIVSEFKAELNGLYAVVDEPNFIISQMLEIANFKGTKSEKIAVLRRLVDLKVEPLENELNKQNISEEQILSIKTKMFEFVRVFYEARFQGLLMKIANENILDKFDLALLYGVHSVGLAINAWQPSWEKQILQTTNKAFEDRFSSMSEAIHFIDKNKLYQLDGNLKGDRSYGAVVQDSENFSFVPYAVAFKDKVLAVEQKFDMVIKQLEVLATNDQHYAYIEYFKKLKSAFSHTDNDTTIMAWQEAERAWMKITSPIQVGHPLEYYEDAYTHAVALEWDIRLSDNTNFDEAKFKVEILQSYEKICAEIGIKDENLNFQVEQNIKRTQTYICVPMIYYGAELNGLFSAQVVPNDETVSSEYGKKIFAFVNHVYESAKSRPFMRLSSEIFDRKFLDFGRDILFRKPNVWKKVYEISTIGHEFGHILFIDTDTEKAMNSSGEFKFIEEYKATTGGLVNFFLHELNEYKMPVFHELIARAVGLIAWREVDEVRAYYCEGLMHLSLLFNSGVLKFDNEKLIVDFSDESYNSFKNICLQNYKNLAKHYAKRENAGEFLAKFCQKDAKSYLPKDKQAREFVEYYYRLYKKIGNEIDESGEWEKWRN